MTLHTQMPNTDHAVPVRERLFLGLPTWIRAGRDETGGALSLVEQIIPPGFESAWHIHHEEDESFYLIDGTLELIVEDRSRTLGPGDYAFGPTGIAHGFRVVGTAPARLLLMTTGSGFADFIQEASDPADEVQPSAEPDIPRLIAVAERHGLSILGPLPR